MSNFPSWVEKNSKALFLIDSDVKSLIASFEIESWDEGVDHSAICLVFGPQSGNRCSGATPPAEFADAIRAGKCNKMALSDPFGAYVVKHLLPQCVLAKLEATDDWKMAQALDDSFPPDEFASLVDGASFNVRAIVASSPRCPQSLLLRLASENSDVRHIAIRNKAFDGTTNA